MCPYVEVQVAALALVTILLILFRQVAKVLGLREGTEFRWVCLGENGFGPMIDDLARLPFDAMDISRPNQTHPGGAYLCDIGVSSITANVERARMGILFSRATHRSHLAVMVLAPLQPRGRWAFFQPLASPVWLSLGATILIVPFIVFFFEAVFSAKYAAAARTTTACITDSPSHIHTEPTPCSTHPRHTPPFPHTAAPLPQSIQTAPRDRINPTNLPSHLYLITPPLPPTPNPPLAAPSKPHLQTRTVTPPQPP